MFFLKFAASSLLVLAFRASNVFCQTLNGMPVITNPGVNPSLAFDPLVYSALTGYLECPGFEIFKDCYYYGIKRFVPTINQIAGNWSCAAGSFCLSTTHSSLCSPGFMCLKDTVQPTICPQGYYCSSDAVTVTRCPEGSFCPFGSVTPTNCHSLAFCPAGSSSVNKFVIFIIFFIFIVIVWFAFQLKSKLDDIQRLKFKKFLAAHVSVESLVQMKPNKTKFDIEFDDLGLTLPNGIRIMSGVSGRLHSGRTCAIMGPRYFTHFERSIYCSVVLEKQHSLRS